MALLQLDLQIHQLEEEIAHAAAEQTPVVWLASKYEALSDLYFDKSRRTRELDDFETARTLSRAAIGFGNGAETDSLSLQGQQGQWWALQGCRLQKHYTRFQSETADLDAAIDAFDKSLTCLPEGSRLRFEALLNQANCYSARFDVSADVNDVDRAIRSCRELCEIPEATDSDKASIRNNMAIMYRSRYEKRHNLRDLERAERHAEEAVNGTGEDDKNLPTRLLNLAACRCMLFEEDGDVQRVNSALQDLEKADNMSRAWDLDCLPQVLSKRARAMYLRYVHRGDQLDMQRAIFLAQQALDVARSDEVEDTRIEIVRQLAQFLSVTDSQGRSVEDLEAAILRGEIPVNPVTTG